MTKKQETERAEALETLRSMNVEPGSTVYTILRHVSRSGMRREIGIVIPVKETPDFFHPNYAAATVLGARVNERGDGIIVSGCGMDMGFHAVYNLSCALFPNGFGCIGNGCPSNDHSNGDRDYTPHHGEVFTAETCPGRPCSPDCDHKERDGRDHWHKDGGYALRHRWL